jgi:integrase
VSKRKYPPVSGYPGICRILVEDLKSGKWSEPRRGKRFRAEKYVKGTAQTSKRVFAFFDSFAEAKSFRSNQCPIATDVKMEVNRSFGPTFPELVEAWKATWLPNKDVSTQIRYLSYLQHFKFFNEMRVEAIEPLNVDQWIAHIKNPEYLARGHSTRCSYHHEFSVLRGILNFYASRFNRNYRLPFIRDHLRMLKVRDKMKVVKDLNVGEFKKFMDALREVCTEFNCEVIFHLALMQYALYCRVQEAAAIHCDDFDYERNRVTIKRKVQWLRSRGHVDQVVDGSKANGGKEIPRIPELATKVLREWMMKSGIREGLLFRMEGGLISYRQIEYRYTQALRRAGLPFTATHILRHAALSEHYDACKDVMATKEMAGHKDLKSTMKYVKARKDTVALSQSQMDERLSVLM